MSRKNKLFLVLFVVISISIVFFFYSKHYKDVVIMGQKIYTVDVSDNSYTLQKGLSGRPTLGDGEGMLFVFKEPDNYGFWMQDMNFPIDIIWMDENFVITHIEKSLSPDTYPNVYYPGKDSLYVLEVRAGDTDRLGVKEGDKVRWLK